ncbi:methyl-accepting chemotaxis protein [Bdellovibrio bacteriovorus]|uniref:methyl-accepting chemotaxis protein n=1 Tax=Bdellovibrio bacteriovorus TaxID=959 RepID=UPI0021D28932|nr:methyl-accepting chemotaxis protein [Bdellovibrio bacteriovorus]UXR63649.1 methyl-accepting chemotaxis protein [Bdellovibrio bacteriovorus]
MNSLTTWFRGLRGRLLFSATLPIVAFAILTGIAWKSMSNLGGMLTDAYTNVVPNMDALGQLGMQRARIGYFIWAALANNDDPKSREVFTKKAREAFSGFKEFEDVYTKSNFLPEEAANYAKTQAIKDRFYALTDQMIYLLEANNADANKQVHKAMNGGDWHVMAITYQNMIADNMKVYRDVSAENDKLQQQQRTHETQLLWLISAFCSFLVFGILMWIAYRVSNTVGTIATGLSESGNQVSSAIVQLTAAGQTLSQSSTEAAASLEETVASLEEMSSMVQMNSDNAKQAAALSQSSKDAAEQGQSEIQLLITSMNDISQSSKKIEEIISVIDDIAFQTNLLALNAAVEAARAGEQGKGFAVVAEAVRALAQRSASAAKDITTLIKDSVEKVDRGSQIADRSGDVLNTIVNSVKKVSDLNTEIAAASSEQTTGIQQISKAMNQLDQGSQANAASSEEIAASSEEISAQAKQMQTMVINLNEVVAGVHIDKAAPTSSAPAAKATKAPVTASTSKSASPKKVIPFPKQPVKAATPKVEKKPQSSSIIPFDEDEGRGKVGTTDGF